MVIKDSKERGAVSLLSVIFFMVILSVITLGFAKLMVQEQRQALDNSLSASARSAAEAGVEDAKRAILDYVQNDNPGDLYDFDQTECPGFINDNGLRNRLGINFDAPAGGVQVSGDPSYLQYYTCVLVNLNSVDYIRNIAQADESVIVPLDGTSPFEEIRFSWHSEEDGLPDSYFDGGATYKDLPKTTQLLGEDEEDPKVTPAYMRLQFITVPNPDDFSIDEISKNTRTVFLNPKPDINNGNLNSNNLNVKVADGGRVNPDDQKPLSSKALPVTVNCWNPEVVDSPMPAYACKAKLDLDSLGPIGNQKLAFLRVTPLYVGTTFRIQLLHDGDIVPFELVQPVVDSTGRANDVFRRIEARIELGLTDTIANNALEISEGICKNFLVTSEPNHFANYCND